MKLYVDDEREPPDYFELLAKNYDQAIAYIDSGVVTLISLDHDLGNGKTGYDIAKYIEEGALNGTIKQMTFRVHSQNPVGRENIKAALRSAARFWLKRERSEP